MNRILVCDSLEESGLALLAASGAEVHVLTADERPRLAEIVAGYEALIVRSSTKVTADLLRAGRRLKVVGRAGIGVDNVDVPVATELGILVVNAPTANLISATEHTFALLLSLLRQVPAADASMKRGEWDRKSYVGSELFGKTVGVIGFGRIGQGVAARARSFEAEVLAHDPYLDSAVARRLGVEPVELSELLARADIVTLHTPFTPETRNLLSADNLRQMKAGSYLINCARGGIVDEAALVELLDAGHLAGAGVDVFVEEPPTSFALAQHPKVVATPHIGAQTHEAQERIAQETARMLIAALAGSLAVSAVNLPFRPAGAAGEPYLLLAERLGRLASALAGGSLTELKVDLWGIDEGLRPALAVAALKGALSPFLPEGVNYVNAERLAKDRGIAVVVSAHSVAADYPQLVRVALAGANTAIELAGALVGDRDPRVVSIDGFQLEFRPEGRILWLRNQDVPGVVGKLGTFLGQAGVNIAGIHLARHDSARAMAVLHLDSAPPEGVLRQLAELPEVQMVRFVDMG
ncbi:MAG TPA: phosphoglycerate dehydrogenase [Thermoanaerobaculia bacterium]|nr:phosphoglycerate dehydrogenase [Thermoanaerobaculia bacterium]